MRNLEKASILNLKKPIRDKNNIILENSINKDINYNIKRRTDSLPKYTPEMGSLSENDSIYYIPDIQKTVFKFNKTYFGDEYSNNSLRNLPCFEYIVQTLF